MNNKFTVGSMFAGIGGICLGMEHAGFEIKWANEIDKHACKTYKNNFPNNKLYDEDVKFLNPEELGEVDVITSGFPCQAFSIAGYRKGLNDKRGELFFDTARFIEALRPKAFLLENVKNLVGHDKGKTFKIIKKTLKEDLGYSVIDFVLNAKDYGNVPQNRERIYLVGFRDEADYIHFPSSKLLNLTNIDEFPYSCKFEIPQPIRLTNTIHNFLYTEKQDDRFYYHPEHKYYKIMKEEIKSKDTIYQWRRVYLRENKNNVCPTLTANMGTGGHNVPIIEDDFGFRKLTPKECARFQGFPDYFSFPKDMALSHQYKQIGNSVVVPVVKRIADNIYKALNNINIDKKIT